MTCIDCGVELGHFCCGRGCGSYCTLNILRCTECELSSEGRMNKVCVCKQSISL